MSNLKNKELNALKGLDESGTAANLEAAFAAIDGLGDLTATAAELNKLHDAGADVTAANLTDLCDGSSAGGFHTHQRADLETGSRTIEIDCSEWHQPTSASPLPTSATTGVPGASVISRQVRTNTVNQSALGSDLDTMYLCLRLPEDYAAGTNLTMQFLAIFNGGVPADGWSIDMEAYPLDDDGEVGSNIIPTGVPFSTGLDDSAAARAPAGGVVLAGTGFSPGDLLICKVEIDLDDTSGEAGAKGLRIYKTELTYTSVLAGA